ncbi:MAG: ribonuclease Z [Candidatus Aenigmatarchaeota archaeon]|nr:MAG: ribonuclease Z [Candidatus Aenigmarchaeota archaeon]
MLEIVFLGTGSGIPTRRRNHSSIWLRYGGENMLWDCGEGTQRQILKAGLNFMKIDRIFITHWHADHWAGIIGLIQTMNLEKRKRTLYIYGPDAERFVGDILDLDYWGPRFKIVPRTVPAEGDEITVLFKTKEFEVSSTPVNHTVPSVAYCFKERDRINVDLKSAGKYGLRQGPLIGKLKKLGEMEYNGKKISIGDISNIKRGVKLVYSGDTRPCKALEKLAQDADVLIHDTTFVEEQKNRMHSGAKEAATIAKKAKVRRLIMTHFSRRYQNTRDLEDEAKKVFKDTVAAEDFMRFSIKADGITKTAPKRG